MHTAKDEEAKTQKKMRIKKSQRKIETSSTTQSASLKSIHS